MQKPHGLKGRGNFGNRPFFQTRGLLEQCFDPQQSFPLRPVLRHIAQPFLRLTRGQTLEVRGVVRNERVHVLLVRHSYAPGWLFQGGGVERSETLEQALAREMSEEVGVTVEGKALLFGIYVNFERFPGDHVALFLIDAWRREPVRSLEIAED